MGDAEDTPCRELLNKQQGRKGVLKERPEDKPKEGYIL
jgi:hypothetical protein